MFISITIIITRPSNEHEKERTTKRNESNLLSNLQLSPSHFYRCLGPVSARLLDLLRSTACNLTCHNRHQHRPSCPMEIKSSMRVAEYSCGADQILKCGRRSGDLLAWLGGGARPSACRARRSWMISRGSLAKETRTQGEE